jgi:hypothetical protein
MKKLLFLSLMLLVAFGTAFAALNAVQPPGDEYSPAVLAVYGVNDGIFTQSTDLVSSAITAEPTNFQAVLATYNEAAKQPEYIVYTSEYLGAECTCGGSAVNDYHLRL